MKKTVLFLATAAFTILISCIAFAGSSFSSCWVQDSAGNWKVQYPNGSYVSNAWFCDDAVAGNGQNVWYLLDANGNMITAGLVQDGTGNYYSLETNHNGYYGMLRYQPGTYDGVYLDLESSHNGSFAAIKNADGIEALKAKYGLTVVNINNSNCVYSSAIVGSGSASSQGVTDKNAEFAQMTAAELSKTAAQPGWTYTSSGNAVIINSSMDSYNLSDAEAKMIAEMSFGSEQIRNQFSNLAKEAYTSFGMDICFVGNVYNKGNLVYTITYTR